MRHFSIKQTKVFTYTHEYLMSPCACFKCKLGLKKTEIHVVRQTAFYCRTCKNLAKLWLMHAKVFERESKANYEHNVAILSKICTIF